MLRQPIKLTQHHGLEIVTAPTSEPVTVADMREHLRVGEEVTTGYLQDLIAEARQHIEDMTNLAMITQSWKVVLDRWPSSSESWWDGVRDGAISSLQGTMDTIELPRYPLSSITSVTVYDEDGNSTAVTVASTFDVDTVSKKGRMTLQRGASWPVALRANNAIEIEFVAGYGAATAVPAPLKRAIKQMAAYLYRNRGDCDPGDAYKDSGAKSAVDAYRVRSI